MRITAGTRKPATTVPDGLHPHQFEALKQELQDVAYQGKNADEAYALLTTPVVMQNGTTRPSSYLRRLGAVRFLTQEKYDAIPQKRRDWMTKEKIRVVILPAEVIAQFTTGIPGFPNKVTRLWFNAAWKEIGR